jgi:hypothetical protein
MTYNFTFTTRDEYLAYRTDWRAKYKALTLEIRANKAAQRANKGDNADLQSALHYLRVRANKMMLERTAATEFKNNQLAASVAQAA